MKTINQVMLAGHVGRPPRITQTPQGTEVAELSLATHRAVREGDGWSQVAEWHTVVAFDHNARLVAQHVGKGELVTVLGELRYERWEDERGQKRTTAKVVARTLVVGRSRGENLSGYSSGEPSPPPRPGSPLPEEADLPF